LLGSMRAPDDSEVRAGLVGSARSRACLSVCLLPRCVCVCFRTRFCPFSRFLLLHYMCVWHRRAPPCAASCARPRLTRRARWALPLGGKLGTLTRGNLGTQTWGNPGTHAWGSECQCRLFAARLRRTVLQRHSTRTYARMHTQARARTRTHHARAHARDSIPSLPERPDAVTAGGDR
jgi:hypothetical protein